MTAGPGGGIARPADSNFLRGFNPDTDPASLNRENPDAGVEGRQNDFFSSSA
jgi:hypothetical protein